VPERGKKRLRSPLAQAVLPVLAGIGFLALIALVLWGVASLVSSGGDTIEVNLGDNEFDAGPAEARAEEIAARGPALFPGLVSADQGYIILTHLGDDPTEGWYAFAAVPEGQAVRCAVQWDAAAGQFLDPCTGRTFPPDGRGLTPFPVRVDDDEHVVVDLTPEGVPGQGPSTVPPPTEPPPTSTILITGTTRPG
jgi:hypothetical protein